MSDDIAVRVENLSKRYTLRHQRAGGDGLRHALQEKVTAPFRWARQRFSSAPSSTPEARSTSEDFWALQDVSFEIKRGEVVGIIGRNGAGKSTLLKILSRITEPTSGRITIEGRVASLLEVGTGFHPELTGRENIFLNGAILGMSRLEIKSKFDEIVAFAEIERFLDTPVKRYSSGMYVRLAFAVAAHLEPEILIIDEVLAVGDSEFQKKCLGRMKDVSSSGRTVVFVSHDLRTVQAICGHSVLLSSGRVVSIGPSAKIVAQYLELAPETQNPFSSRKPTPATRALLTSFKATGSSPSTAPCAGHPCCLSIGLTAYQQIPTLRVAVGIDDRYGRRLLTLDTQHYKTSFTVNAGPHQIQCRLSALPLKPDEYRVHIYIGDIHEPYDYINGSLSLNIETPTIYPNSILDEAHGPIVQAQEWIRNA